MCNSNNGNIILQRSSQCDLVVMGKICLPHHNQCQLMKVYGNSIMTVKQVRKWCRELKNDDGISLMMSTPVGMLG